MVSVMTRLAILRQFVMALSPQSLLDFIPTRRGPNVNTEVMLAAQNMLTEGRKPFPLCRCYLAGFTLQFDEQDFPVSHHHKIGETRGRSTGIVGVIDQPT